MNINTELNGDYENDSINNYIRVIETLYQTMNVYQSFFVYSQNDKDKMRHVCDSLIYLDYPIKYYDISTFNYHDIESDMSLYRIFVIPIEYIFQYLTIWAPFYENISLVITFGGQCIYKEYNSIIKNSRLQLYENYLSISM